MAQQTSSDWYSREDFTGDLRGRFAPHVEPRNITFRAKPGKEGEFEALLNSAESGRAAAKAMGATRNTLFLGGGRMVRILEFPDGTKPVPMAELAAQDPTFKEFLRKIGYKL